MEKVTLDPFYLISYLTNDFQVDYRSKRQRQTMKVLEENNSGNLGLGFTQQGIKSSNHKGKHWYP